MLTVNVCVSLFVNICQSTNYFSQIHRYYGRKMLFLMMDHPNFEKMLEKYIPSKDLPYIKESVKNLRQKVCELSLLCILKSKTYKPDTHSTWKMEAGGSKEVRISSAIY